MDQHRNFIVANCNSPNRLTEFPPLESEQRSDSKFSFSKFLFWKKNEDVASGVEAVSEMSRKPAVANPDKLEEPSSITNTGSNDSNKHSLNPSIDPGWFCSSPDPSEGGSSPFIFEARTLPNVLKRISSLVAMGSNNQSDMKKYWMPDSVSKECYDCADKFTTFRRKHHCRICGQIFCSRCCNQEIPGKIIGYSGDLRVCTYCCKIVLSYLKNADVNSEQTDDLKLVQEDLQNKFGECTSAFSSSQGFKTAPPDYASGYRSLQRRKPSLGYQEERFCNARNLAFENASDEYSKFSLDWATIKEWWEEICDPITGIHWEPHRHNRNMHFNSSSFGSEIVDWLIAQRKISNRDEGVQVGQLLIEMNLIECVSQESQVFMDAYVLYQAVHLPLPGTDRLAHSKTMSSSNLYNGDSSQDPLWVKQIGFVERRKLSLTPEKEAEKMETNNVFASPKQNEAFSSATSFSMDINLSNTTVSLSKPRSQDWDKLNDKYEIFDSGQVGADSADRKKWSLSSDTERMMSSTSEIMTEDVLLKAFDNHSRSTSTSFDMCSSTNSDSNGCQKPLSNDELVAFRRLCNAYVRHEHNLLKQLLQAYDLNKDWGDIILPIVHKIIDVVKPDLRYSNDEMDIRHYVKFKKIPGGSQQGCRIVNGVVCTKEVVHQRMRNKIKAPKILLIGSSIDYQRFENRFLSLEPLVMQEYEYLRNIVAKISALQPDIILVEKSVSRLAQEFFLEKGITLVINVKASVLERVARSTQAGILSSAEMQLGNIQLGVCHNFYVETFDLGQNRIKRLMFFDGCALHLGATVLLRGGVQLELVKVKKIISFMMFVAYNWKLERSFHVDSFAMPPLQDEDMEKNDGEVGAAEGKNRSLDVRSYQYTEDSFENKLQTTILSSSPFIPYHCPYLETTKGKQSELRLYFPDQIFWYPKLSKQFLSVESSHRDTKYFKSSNSGDRAGNELKSCTFNSSSICTAPKIPWKSPHSFTKCSIVEDLSSESVQSSISDFRRKGSRLNFSPQIQSKFIGIRKELSNISSWNTIEDKNSSNRGKRIDCLDPMLHQKLSLLFCSYSPVSGNSPYYCLDPWVVHMDMYGRNDISLGMFLEKYCFRKSYICPARQCNTPMLHHIRRFSHEDGSIYVQLREMQMPVSNEAGDSILMWNWCPTCKNVSPCVPITPDSWCLSFAKYLELRFYGKDFSRRGFESSCTHSLHQECQQFFAYQKLIATFRYSKVRLLEISLPALSIDIVSRPQTVEELIEAIKPISIAGHGLYMNIADVICSLKDTCNLPKLEEILCTMTEELRAEKHIFKSKIEDIQIDLASDTLLEDKEIHLWRLSDSISFLKSSISDAVNAWNSKLQDFILFRKKEEKQLKVSKSDGESSYNQSLKPKSESLTSSTASNSSTSYTVRESGNDGAVPASSFAINSNAVDQRTLESKQEGNKRNPDESLADEGQGRKETICAVEQGVKGIGGAEKTNPILDVPSTEVMDNNKQEKKIVNSSNTVKALISNLLSGSAAGQLILSPWSHLEHHLPASWSTIPITVYENEPSSLIAFALSSNEYRNKLLRPKTPGITKTANDQQGLSIAANLKVIDSHPSQSFSWDQSYIADSLVAECEVEEKSSSGKDNSNCHIVLEFASGSAKFYCRIYFAEKFRQMRKRFMEGSDNENFFIRSIARCASWAVSGGKSGSKFCKTLDDRLVIKQMSKIEIESFLEFASNYFEYLEASFKDHKPTTLAKIFGVYRIGMKNSQTNAASKMDVLIMENLFYNRKISQKFDLKGSIRNRLATSRDGKESDLVLLDENLVNMSCENPFHMRPHTKSLLSMALRRDSQFLASQMVMDYSLLVGLDDTNEELVIGIIDYIRTFTWDKRIENFLKSSIAAPGKTPTIVSPEEYQTRFCEAMDRYFLLTPDRWMSFAAFLEQEPVST